MPNPTSQLRPVRIEAFPGAAPGSVIITQGATRVLCTASVSEEVPAWMIDRSTGAATQGWVTAEYAMLPGATPQRKKRGPDGRATEIQRFIGRALRAAVDLRRMPGLTITCDCDVIVADGGTRTAAITGACVALAQAARAAQRAGLLRQDPMTGTIAAVSVGLVDGKPSVDLDYERDSRADVDMNVVMNDRHEIVEVQAAAEGSPFTRSQLDELLDLAGHAIDGLMKIQRRALAGKSPGGGRARGTGPAPRRSTRRR
jgi:ribonuclease PH